MMGVNECGNHQGSGEVSDNLDKKGNGTEEGQPVGGQRALSFGPGGDQVAYRVKTERKEALDAKRRLRDLK